MKYLIVFVALMLSACSHRVPDQPRNLFRGTAPQSAWMTARNHDAGVAQNAPVLLRIFKQEHELELWRQRGDQYVLVATFEICKLSGELGPKVHVGDRQAPEGFYSIYPHQMNPGSREWLSFDTGYPNEFDRFYHRTGNSIMVHGGCSSIGCFAINDGPMQDLYAVMRDAFAAGQTSIQLQIYPKRMTVMADLSGPWADFWQQLKAGYDRYEQTGQPLVISVINGRYYFN
jgi:murein L,D-transpeptidase YafK